MESNQIIILCAVLFIVISFTIYFIGIIRIGRKNALKNKYKIIVPLYHTDIFKFEDKIAIKLNKLLVDVINDNKEIDSVSIEVKVKQPTNKF